MENTLFYVYIFGWYIGLLSLLGAESHVANRGVIIDEPGKRSWDAFSSLNFKQKCQLRKWQLGPH